MTTVNVVNGPNLGRLGRRETQVYGSTTHDDLVAMIEREATDLGLKVVVRQSDSEAELLDWIHRAADAGEPVVLNAGALTHTSIALRDACAELRAPLIEVHISNVHAREEFRHHSYLSAVATGVIVGLGVQGYLLALRYLAARARAGCAARWQPRRRPRRHPDGARRRTRRCPRVPRRRPRGRDAGAARRLRAGR